MYIHCTPSRLNAFRSLIHNNKTNYFNFLLPFFPIFFPFMLCVCVSIFLHLNVLNKTDLMELTVSYGAEPLEMSYLLGIAGGCLAAIFMLICLCIYAVRLKKCCFKGNVTILPLALIILVLKYKIKC